MAKVRRETVAEQGLSILRAQILDGTLKPGDAVTEEAMAQELGISRPTLREVLKTLVGEGLLTRHPSTRILQVTTLTVEEVREMYVARRVLECAGIDAAASLPDEAFAPLRETLEEMAEAVAGRDHYGLVQTDRRCHSETVALTGSRYLISLHDRLMARMNLTLSQVESDEPSDYTEVLRLHREYCTLIMERRPEEAKAQLLQRLEVAEQEVTTSLETRRATGSNARRSVRKPTRDALGATEGAG